MQAMHRALPVAVVAAALCAAPAQAVVHVDDRDAPRYADVDVRTATIAPTSAQEEIVARLDARARWNELGTPRSLIRDGGFLASGIQAESAEAAARRFVSDNLELFRLSSLDTLEAVHAEALTGGGGGHTVVFNQRYDGRPAAVDGALTVALDRADDGWRVAYASSTLSGDETLSAARSAQRLSAEEAWAEAARAVGVRPSTAQLRSARRQAGGFTQITVAGSGRPGLVREVAFPTPERGAVAAFETYVDRDAGESYRQIVDAATGDVLYREPATDNFADNPRWEVFPSNPRKGGDRYPWNYPSSDIRETWCWEESRRCDETLEGTGSRVPWDVDARTNQPTNTTVGNNARAGENWQNSSVPQPVQYRPVSEDREYRYPWENIWFEASCNPNVFTPGGNDIDAATVNLFAMHNRMHDWSYGLGFTEATWNAQDFNFGINSAGENDPILGDVQAGGVTGGAPTYSGRDNANMNTRPDGTPSWSNMYLWQPISGTFYAPCVDGDYDMSVIAHEYGHMIENRMIGKGNRRSGSHAGAMGESAGDLMAMEYLNEWGYDDTTLVGEWVTSNDEHGIRNYDMAFPSSGGYPQPGRYPEVNPLNFGAVGYDITGPQEHADGEIWSATNYDLRELFLQRYPARSGRTERECAAGNRPAEQCSGARRWVQIMFDSFLIMPPRPTFLDARDAQLAADMVRFDGANQDLLWLGFARRGFGQNALTVDATDSEPRPDFESPRHGEATVTFEAVAKDEGRQPVPARIYAGHYEARVSPIADTDPATAGDTPATGHLDNVARFVPGERGGAYDFVANAPGYGHVRFRLSNLRPGENRRVRLELPTNWASQSKGATASGDGTRHGELIDDTEGTNWESTGQPVEGRQVLVRLSGERRFDRLKVSAMLLPAQAGPPARPAQNRFTALRQFEVLACEEGDDRRNPTCDPAVSGGFRRVLRSQDDAFPSVPARPVAPELALRNWSVSRTSATHVLFRVLHNQCTGQRAFQGVQDADPTNETDCRVPGALPARNTEVRAAELQLLSSRPSVSGAQAVE